MYIISLIYIERGLYLENKLLSLYLISNYKVSLNVKILFIAVYSPHVSIFIVYELMLNCLSYIRRKRFIYIENKHCCILLLFIYYYLYHYCSSIFLFTFAVIIILLIVHRCISYMPQKRS